MVDLFKEFKIEEEPSLLEIIDFITHHTRQWKRDSNLSCPWYRGQSGEFPPKPGLFRKKYDEFNLNTTFRNRVSALKDTPDTKRLDMWLF